MFLNIFYCICLFSFVSNRHLLQERPKDAAGVLSVEATPPKRVCRGFGEFTGSWPLLLKWLDRSSSISADFALWVWIEFLLQIWRWSRCSYFCLPLWPSNPLPSCCIFIPITPTEMGWDQRSDGLFRNIRSLSKLNPVFFGSFWCPWCFERADMLQRKLTSMVTRLEGVNAGLRAGG